MNSPIVDPLYRNHPVGSWWLSCQPGTHSNLVQDDDLTTHIGSGVGLGGVDVGAIEVIYNGFVWLWQKVVGCMKA